MRRRKGGRRGRRVPVWGPRAVCRKLQDSAPGFKWQRVGAGRGRRRQDHSEGLVEGPADSLLAGTALDRQEGCSGAAGGNRYGQLLRCLLMLRYSRPWTVRRPSCTCYAFFFAHWCSGRLKACVALAKRLLLNVQVLNPSAVLRETAQSLFPNNNFCFILCLLHRCTVQELLRCFTVAPAAAFFVP